MDLDDVRYLIAECRTAGVKVFLKQLGTRWAVDSNT
jgi:EAL domain-containing protein (putative c-di-GMP-specific phosphodiesterase class I)